jgi:PIN domain nuclease of toxin-antitoxin system
MATSPRYLLDTSTFLWTVGKPEDLSKRARDAVADESATLFLSMSSIWELQIKHALGKLPLRQDAHELAERFVGTLKPTLLEISLDHIGHLYRLPNIHRDPFDRMLVAQALAEGLTIVTPDPMIAAYPVKVLW